MYHALVVLESLADPKVLAEFRTVKTYQERGLTFAVVEAIDPDKFIEKIQKSMRKGEPYYFHLYDNGITLRVVFKDEIFRINPNNKNTWVVVQRYGLSHGLSREHLNFYPTRIAEEKNI